jgi:hypothetical protein
MSILIAFLKNIIVLFVGIHMVAYIAKTVAGAERFLLPEAIVYVVFILGTICFFVWGLTGTLAVLGGFLLLYLSCILNARLR